MAPRESNIMTSRRYDREYTLVSLYLKYEMYMKYIHVCTAAGLKHRHHTHYYTIGTFRSLRFVVGWPLKSCTHTGVFPSVSGHPAVKRKPDSNITDTEKPTRPEGNVLHGADKEVSVI